MHAAKMLLLLSSMGGGGGLLRHHHSKVVVSTAYRIIVIPRSRIHTNDNVGRRSIMWQPSLWSHCGRSSSNHRDTSTLDGRLCVMMGRGSKQFPTTQQQRRRQTTTLSSLTSTTLLAAPSTTTTTTTTTRRSSKSTGTGSIEIPKKKKSSIISSGTGNKSSYQAALVVHGPPGFDVDKVMKTKATTSRPFKLVVVESPSKCETISKILQGYVQDRTLDYDFVVTSSMGHILNIPRTKSSKDQAVAGIDVDNNYTPTYEIIPEKETLVRKLQVLNTKAQQLILATDDDREGEAMAAHLFDVLGSQSGDSPNSGKEKQQQQPPLRVRFTEITKKAIVDAMEHPETTLRNNLVQAQETRRILDRLAGFTVSPVLWKKIAPGLSAGRVQSVGMALIVQRERERLAFRETEYWSIKGNFSRTGITSRDDQQELLDAQLVSVDGQSIASGSADFDPEVSNQLSSTARNKLHVKADKAKKLIERIQSDKEDWTWTVQSVSASLRKQSPPLPFITSSLQQEANRRLGLSVSRTMQAAQQLYEKGFISYMRTDSTHFSEDAQTAIRKEIINDYGGEDKYVPVTQGGRTKTTRKSKAKTSGTATEAEKPLPQAAHEAIRPAIRDDEKFIKPNDLPSGFDEAAVDVYRLIYQRTIASHMPAQVNNQTSITILGQHDDKDGQVDVKELLFRISGSVVIDPGYTQVYPHQSESKSPVLPSLSEGQSLECDDTVALMHITQPPARYTEASFVQELETLGVGRPSTFASTVQILRDRSYVGSPVTSDSTRRTSTKEVSGPAISAQRAAGGEEFSGSRDARGAMVPSLTAFVVTSLLEKNCNMYVDPTFTAKMEERLDLIANSPVEVSQDERVEYLNEFYQGDQGLAAKIKHIEESIVGDEARRADLPSLEWNAKENGEEIGVYVGPWGPFVRRVSSAASDNGTAKPVSASLPPGMASDLSTITPTTLNAVLTSKEKDGSLMGAHPDDGRVLLLKVGPYGAYLQWGADGEEGTTTHTLPRQFRSLKTLDTSDSDDYDVSLPAMLGLSLEDAVSYASLPRTVTLLNDLPIVASIGPYGPYLKYNNTYMKLNGKDGDVISIDPDTAQELVIERIVNRKSTLGRGVLAEIGEKDGSMVTVKTGRFGSYISWKKVNAKLPTEYLDEPSNIPLEEAWTLIQEKAPTSNGKGEITMNKGKGKKSLSSYKDSPPPPKRPPSAFLLFSAEKRAEVSAKFSSLGEVSKELGRLWKDVTDEERAKFDEMASIAKSKYEIEKLEWEASNDSHLNTMTRISKSEHDAIKAESLVRSRKGEHDGIDHTDLEMPLPSRRVRKTSEKSTTPLPKRPRSAYILFCKANRESATAANKTLGEVSKELSRRWAELDPTSKKEYNDMAVQDKLRYEQEKIGSLVKY